MYPQALQWHLELQSRQKMVEEFEILNSFVTKSLEITSSQRSNQPCPLHEYAATHCRDCLNERMPWNLLRKALAYRARYKLQIILAKQ